MYFVHIKNLVDPFGDNSCVAWWPFYDSLDDRTGNGHDITGSLTPPSLVPVDRGWGAAHLTNSSALEMTYISDIPSGNDPWTISFWLYSDFSQAIDSGYFGERIHSVITLGNNTASHYQKVHIIVLESGLSAEFDYSIVTRKGLAGHIIGKRIFVTAVYDGTTTFNIRLYLNGVYGANTDSSTDTALNVLQEPIRFNVDLSSGNPNSQSYNVWNVRIFNRALSDNEVANLYEMENPKQIPFHRLVGV